MGIGTHSKPTSTMCLTKPKVAEDAHVTVQQRSPKFINTLSRGSSNPSTLASSKGSSSFASTSSICDILPDKPILYAYAEISRATNNFKIGKIASSSVFKCNLRGKIVAVTEKTTKNYVDFVAKLGELCSIHHRSVIGLVGGCVEGERIFLAYQYIEGTSLKDCLRGGKLKAYTVLKSWFSRMQVAVDVAQAMEYLHHDTGVNYVHKYLKSSSVIVMEPGLRSMIAHFGACELCGENPQNIPLKRSQSNRIAGAPGYMAPEFANYGVVSQKSDVFAFGVIMLELLSGEEPVKFEHDEAKRIYKRVSLVESLGGILSQPNHGGLLRAWIDPRLKDSFPIDCAERFAEVAASCLHSDPEQRPDMRCVVVELTRVYVASRKWADSMSSNKEVLSTTFEGR